jgi:hypothetical protein
MKKNNLHFCHLFAILSLKKTDNTQYVCDNKGAKKYHFSETCRGFGACKHQIVKTTQSKARDIGLTLCGWE